MVPICILKYVFNTVAAIKNNAISNSAPCNPVILITPVDSNEVIECILLNGKIIANNYNTFIICIPFYWEFKFLHIFLKSLEKSSTHIYFVRVLTDGLIGF